MEAEDVIAGEYEVFDSCGRELTVAVDTSTKRVTIQLEPDDGWRPDEFTRRLRHYIRRVGPARFDLDGPVDELTLSQLVSAMARFHLP